MKLKQSLSLFLLFVAMPMLAQQISVDEAMKSARQFLNGSSDSRSRTQAKARLELAYTSEKDGKNCFYVFNSQMQDGGFVIVGADEAAEEILGYCPNGSFNYDSIPDNFRWWLSQYDAQISVGIKQGVKRAARSKVARESIGPLMTTQWNQNDPFNCMFNPADWTGNNALATGCVATAMAQVMKYHNYPTTGIGSAVCSHQYKGMTFDADFAATTYDWKNMLDEASEMTTKEQREAVGTLLYHCGVAVDMLYGTIIDGGSAAITSAIPQALINHFGYDKSVCSLDRTFYTDDEWEAILYDQLAQGQPVVYAGEAANNAGHAFVCDGYTDGTDKWHINWGWGGYCDGDFAISGAADESVLEPEGSGIGGTTQGEQYRYNQEIVINVKPDVGGDYTYIMGWRGTHTLTESTVTRGTTVAFSGNVQNNTLLSLHYQLGAKFEDTTTGDVVYVEIPDMKNAELSASAYYADENILASCSISTGAVPEGEYTVVPVFRVLDGDDWIELVYNGTAPVLTITAPQGCIMTSGPTVGNDEYTTPNAQIYFSMKNYGEGIFKKDFVVYAFPGNGGNSQVVFSATVTIPAGEEVNVTLPITYTWSALVEKQCYFFVFDGTNYYFNVVPEKSVSFTMTSAGFGTLIMPFDAALPDGLKAYTCNSVDGNKLVLEEADKLQRQVPYLISGAEATYEWKGPDVPHRDYYRQGMLLGALGNYTLTSSDYVMQDIDGAVGFYTIAGSALEGATLTPGRCVLTSTSTSASAAVTAFFFPGEVAPTAIGKTAATAVPTGIYDLGGIKRKTLQKGINIIRQADGTSIKAIVK